ncbi:hypothetical protein R3P38DRAFT_2829230 [Favolaschia claudopus]|uniref:Oxidoreductase-like domain-containing protein n=1 Tax=Favolaschia claudopus TaxID=2862362 RepID=A0AAW0ECZ4_9AGAR
MPPIGRYAFASRLRLSGCISNSRSITLDAGAIQRMKRPTRGGQNLSLRYRRLEQSLRGKDALQRDIRARESDAAADAPFLASGVTQDVSRYFRGLEIPHEPKPPQSDECCMSGCAVCVYDLYEESLEAYQQSLAVFRLALQSSGVAEESWPQHTRIKNAASSKKTVTLTAFEELEQSLKAKKDPILSEVTSPIQRRQNPTWTVSELFECVQWLAFSRR